MNICDDLETRFSPNNLKDYFDSKMIDKKGGGRDNLSPKQYKNNYAHDFDVVSRKCLNGSYRFTAYNEILVLKGREKYPRVISIPTVRDRLVLGVLNDLLQFKFQDCVNHNTPNHYIDLINYQLANNDGVSTFFKTDICDFYGSINQDLLLEKIKLGIKDERILHLIRSAIQTPTYAGKRKDNISCLCTKGIPQGLSISNILASIYMHEFDLKFSIKNNEADFSNFRYVDDLLFINPQEGIKEEIQNYFNDSNMTLDLSDSKTQSGVIGFDELDYLGYVFKDKCISIRKSSIDKYISRLARICVKYKNEYHNVGLRPSLLVEDNVLTAHFIEELNMIISGVKVNSRLYGWLPYFQKITDISLMYKLDKILTKKLLKGVSVDLSKINTFVASFYSIKERRGGKLVFDYDTISTIDEIRTFLVKRGVISVNNIYRDEQLRSIFEDYKYSVVRKFEENIGYF